VMVLVENDWVDFFCMIEGLYVLMWALRMLVV
jgi:hypothetical protein